MPQYFFFPTTSAGASPSLDASELESDGAAMLRAELVLAEHASCSSVAVWAEERLVLVVYRGLLSDRAPMRLSPSERDSGVAA